MNVLVKVIGPSELYSNSLVFIYWWWWIVQWYVKGTNGPVVKYPA